MITHDPLCPVLADPDPSWCLCGLITRVRADERERDVLRGVSWKVALRDNEDEVLERLRAQVDALPVVLVDLDPDPHGRPIVRQAVALSDVLALLDGAQPAPEPTPTTPTRVSTDVRDSIWRGVR